MIDKLTNIVVEKPLIVGGLLALANGNLLMAGCLVFGHIILMRDSA